MKKFNSILLVLLALFLSCDDVFEEEITNDLVQIISPTNGSVIEGNITNFSWANLDGADDYRIQIINESQIRIVDSLVSSNGFTYSLSPGNYQWRVKGENFAYQTEYTFPVSFSTEASEDLTNQNVVLLTPTNDHYTNDTNVIVTWEGIITADNYSLELIKNLTGLETVLQEPVITATSYTLNSSHFDVDAEYIWKVKAVNSLPSETLFTERTIFIDTNVPIIPSLGAPLDLESFSTTTVTFNWTNGIDTGNVQSTISNTIDIATDSAFNNIVTFTTEANSYIYDFTSSGTYYWRVKASDLASNESEYSTVRTLEIQ